MKRFEFRLDSALRLRNAQLRKEQLLLQQVLTEEQRLKDSLSALDHERQSSVAAVQNSSLIPGSDLRAISSFLIGINAASSQLRQQIAAKAEEIGKQRTFVMAAERNVKLLEKLKAKRLEEWTHSFDLELEALAQEVWNSTHSRRAE